MNYTPEEASPKIRAMIGNHGDHPVRKVRPITRHYEVVLTAESRKENFTGYVIVDHSDWKRDIFPLTTKRVLKRKELGWRIPRGILKLVDLEPPEERIMGLTVEFNNWTPDFPCWPVGLLLWVDNVDAWVCNPLEQFDHKDLINSFAKPTGCELALRYNLDREGILETYTPYEDVVDAFDD